MVVVGKAQALEILTELKATGKFLDGLTAHLFKSDTTPVGSVVLADLVESDFPGYAAVALGAWGAIWEDGEKKGVAAPSIQFDCTGATSQDVNGVYYTATVGGTPTLRWYEKLEDPLPIGRAGQSVLLLPRFSLMEPTESLLVRA